MNQAETFQEWCARDYDESMRDDPSSYGPGATLRWIREVVWRIEQQYAENREQLKRENAEFARLQDEAWEREHPDAGPTDLWEQMRVRRESERDF